MESGKFLWRTSGSFRDNFAYDFVIMETLLRKNVESIQKADTILFFTKGLVIIELNLTESLHVQNLFRYINTFERSFFE